MHEHVGRPVGVAVCKCEAHLIRDGQQHSVQLLHKLFEGRPLGGNGMPALTHHHVTTGEKHNMQKLFL